MSLIFNIVIDDTFILSHDEGGDVDGGGSRGSDN